MSLFNNQNIELTLSKEDAAIILKCLKIAKARKKLEARQEFSKNNVELFEGKTNLVKKIDQLEHYLHYLTK